VPETKHLHNRRFYAEGKLSLFPIGCLLILATTLSSCGPTGSMTYTGFPLKNKGISASAENGILKSVRKLLLATRLRAFRERTRRLAYST
jgi:hypothetical protein